MFRALHASHLPEHTVFTATVGASTRETAAWWHLLEPRDVISVLALLNGSPDDSNAAAVAIVEGTVPQSRS